MARPYDLSSMTALTCFEASARHLSFKTAAQEMNVTPAAVSHQIKALEGDLGCTLFRRRHRGVELTEKGAFLFVAMQRGLETISEAVTSLREQPEMVDVTISTSTAISSLWLTPKIGAFWKAHPSITVSQMISDVPVRNNRHDLSVHYGNPLDSDEDHRMLFRDRIVALGTPRFAAEYRIAKAEDLIGAPLIQLSDADTGWTSWNDWFAAQALPRPRGRSFWVNNYMVALQAAQDDVGAVLGWDGLVKGLLREERLVQLVPESITSPGHFYIKIHRRASAKARLFADWMAQSS